MSATKSTADHLRGWVRASRRYPAEWQRSRLEAAGAGVIYEHGQSGETVAELIRSLVKGDTVLVATAARLGYTKESVLDAVAKIHSKGAFVMEVVPPQRRSDRAKSWYKSVEAIKAELAGERRTLTTAEATAYGALGGAAKAAQTRVTQAFKDRLRREFWNDRNTYPREVDAVAAIQAHIAPRIASQRTISRWLGPRIKGRKPRKGVVELASEFLTEARPKGRKK